MHYTGITTTYIAGEEHPSVCLVRHGHSEVLNAGKSKLSALATLVTFGAVPSGTCYLPEASMVFTVF